MPKLDMGKVSEQNKTGAPVTVDRLLSTLRSRWKPAHETELFQDFEDRVNEIMQGGGAGNMLDPALRIFTFYDEAIIPAGSAQATIRTTRQVCGESPLEILFGFFCSRQQPGSGYVFACAHVCVRVWACARTNKLVLQQTRIAYGLVGSAFRREPICAKLALDQIAPCSLAAALEKVSRQISSRGWPFCALVGLWYSPR